MRQNEKYRHKNCPCKRTLKLPNIASREVICFLVENHLKEAEEIVDIILLILKIN